MEKRLGLRILVVEDDRASCVGLAEALQWGGHEVVTASNGLEALRRLAAEELDLIISDVAMEGMDGLTLLAQLRAMGRDIPVIMVSAEHTRELCQEAVRRGAVGCIPKPIDLDLLDAVVESTVPLASVA